MEPAGVHVAETGGQVADTATSQLCFSSSDHGNLGFRCLHRRAGFLPVWL